MADSGKIGLRRGFRDKGGTHDSWMCNLGITQQRHEKAKRDVLVLYARFCTS